MSPLTAVSSANFDIVPMGGHTVVSERTGCRDCGTETPGCELMFAMMLAQVLLPVLTDYRLQVRRYLRTWVIGLIFLFILKIIRYNYVNCYYCVNVLLFSR